MYKEYWDTSLCGAVGHMFEDMAGRHRVRADNIHIINTSVLRKSENVKRANTSQFYDP